jgi:hypothetical protein
VLTGDWNKVRELLHKLGSRIENEGQKATAESLQLIEKTVVGHIDRQDLPWKPLSRAYARYKARTRSQSWRRRRLKADKQNPRGLSENILVATGAYREAITSFQTSSFEGEVGVSRQESYAGGEKIANIGAVLELGTRDQTIPARPLWEPSAKEVEDKVIGNFEKALEEALNV